MSEEQAKTVVDRLIATKFTDGKTCKIGSMVILRLTFPNQEER